MWTLHKVNLMIVAMDLLECRRSSFPKDSSHDHPYQTQFHRFLVTESQSKAEKWLNRDHIQNGWCAWWSSSEVTPTIRTASEMVYKWWQEVWVSKESAIYWTSTHQDDVFCHTVGWESSESFETLVYSKGRDNCSVLASSSPENLDNRFCETTRPQFFLHAQHRLIAVPNLWPIIADSPKN